MPKSSERLYPIDFIRTLSILVVMASHYGMARLATGMSTLRDFAAAPGWNVFGRNGTYGVSLFFLISGFLITNLLITSHDQAIETIPVREFYVRRLGRIVPLLLAVVLWGMVLPLFWASPTPILRASFAAPHAAPGVIASILTLTFNWYAILSALHGRYPGMFWLLFWSLSIEEQFYLFYPMLLRGLGQWRRVLVFLGAVIVLGLLSRAAAARINAASVELSLYNSLGAFDQIALGAILSFFYRKIRLEGTFLPGLLMLAGMGLMIATYAGTHIVSATDRIYAPLALDLGLFSFLFGSLHFRWPPTFLARCACLPGQLSYGMYLLHVTALIFTWRWISRMPIWTGFACYTLATTGIAYLSFRFFERPVNSWVRRTFSA